MYLDEYNSSICGAANWGWYSCVAAMNSANEAFAADSKSRAAEKRCSAMELKETQY